MVINNPTQAQLEKFFMEAGIFLGDSIIETGISPNREYTYEANYLKGVARFNGRFWTLQID